MANYVSVTSDKKKKTAFWLCLFGGIFSLHYFYVGRVGKGIVRMFTIQLLFFGWVSDLGKIINGKFTDNTGAYLRE